MIIPAQANEVAASGKMTAYISALLVQLSVGLLKNSYLEEIRDVLGISLHKIYSRLWLYNNHPDFETI